MVNRDVPVLLMYSTCMGRLPTQVRTSGCVAVTLNEKLAPLTIADGTDVVPMLEPALTVVLSVISSGSSGSAES